MADTGKFTILQNYRITVLSIFLNLGKNLLCFAESGSTLSVLLMHCHLYTLFTAILFFILLAGKVIEN